MTKYLILTDAAAADARSRAAWTPGPGDTITTHMWSWRVHPTDGRAALEIPTGFEVGLAEAELAALVDALPEDWETTDHG